MSKFNFLVRKLIVTPGMFTRLSSKVVDVTGKPSPGILIKRADWFFLTYLRIVKINNFDAGMCDLLETEVNTVRAVQFQIKEDGTLLIRGSKAEIEVIDNYFSALALEEAGAISEVAEFDLSKFYQINDPVVDLKNILTKYETSNIVLNVPKIRVDEISVAIGTIKKCIINTSDYVGVKKALQGDEVTGIQINLTTPPDTQVSYDKSGQISISTSKESVDDLDTLIDISVKILG